MRDTFNLLALLPHPSRDGASSGAAPKPDRGAQDPRLALHAADLRSRLRHVCRDWKEDDFEEVVQRMARMKVRWSELDRAD
jgi:hypothetical protein